MDSDPDSVPYANSVVYMRHTPVVVSTPPRGSIYESYVLMDDGE